MRFTFLLVLVSQLALSQSSKVKPYAPEIFSSSTSGAVCGFANRGRTIFFVREDTVAENLILYQAQKKGKTWIGVRPLPFSGKYNDVGARLTPDGNTIYFTSDRPGGSARENDHWNIWISKRTGEIWSEPEPLNAINNKGDECCPLPMPDGSLVFSGSDKDNNEWQMHYINGDEVTSLEALNNVEAWQWPSTYYENENFLLFNSMKREDSRGKDDIYISFHKNGKWTMPLNLGEVVNTPIYEDGAILSSDEKYLIYNQHETGATPSQVVFTKWKPILKALKKQIDNTK